MSKLAFLSKIPEKVVSSRVKEHCIVNKLWDPFQSAYKQFYSVASTLAKVQDDILEALDHRRGVVLVLLDLSAAFDTVDHHALLARIVCIWFYRHRFRMDAILSGRPYQDCQHRWVFFHIKTSNMRSTSGKSFGTSALLCLHWRHRTSYSSKRCSLSSLRR